VGVCLDLRLPQLGEKVTKLKNLDDLQLPQLEKMEKIIGKKN